MFTTVVWGGVELHCYVINCKQVLHQPKAAMCGCNHKNWIDGAVKRNSVSPSPAVSVHIFFSACGQLR